MIYIRNFYHIELENKINEVQIIFAFQDIIYLKLSLNYPKLIYHYRMVFLKMVILQLKDASHFHTIYEMS